MSETIRYRPVAEPAAGQREGADERQREHGRSEGRAERNDRPQDHHLAERLRSPALPGDLVERGDAAGPGQAGDDEGEHGVGHQAVPAAGPQCPVGERQAEIADDRHHAGPGRHQVAYEARQPHCPERDAAQEKDLLHQPHGAEEDGSGDTDDPESRGGRSSGADTGRLPPGEEVVPTRRPARQRCQLTHQRERPEEELPGADHDDQCRHHHRHDALAAGAEE